MDNEIRTLQMDLLSLYRKFAEICKSNKLTYYFIGGSALGAVRHAGFIPWDDDMDVAMPRKDYNKLIYEISRHTPENINIYQNKDLIGCIEDTSIVMELNDNEEIFVRFDIFPIDGTPNNSVIRVLHIFRAFFFMLLYKLTYISRIKDMEQHRNRKKRKKIEKLIIKYGNRLSFIWKRMNPEKLKTKYEKITMKYDYEKSEIVGCYMGRYRFKEFIPKKIIEPVRIVSFENEKVPIFNDVEIYLASAYGEDYMSIPDIDYREKHGDIKLKKKAEGEFNCESSSASGSGY